MRHGQAADWSPTGDEGRPLTPEGSNRVLKIANGLKTLKVQPDLVVSSPLLRARQTAEIVLQVIAPELQLVFDPMLKPDQPVLELERWVREQEADSIFLVGHNPLFSDFVAHLLSGSVSYNPAIELKKGAIAAFVAESRRSPFILDWFAPGRITRRLGADSQRNLDLDH